MILIFDLDDTLYNEIEYVKSGFKEVSKFINKIFYINEIDSFDFMIKYLKRNGRGNIFNALLKKYGIYNKKNLIKCISIYRKHKPNILINKKVIDLLSILSKENSLYLLTDGNKLVQKNKVDALGIKKLFRRIFITHRYGIKNAKPSLYCFKKIKEIEKCNWSDMIYIGDNPNKDFVNLNKVGAKTVRILNGSYKSFKAKEGYDANISYKSITLFLNDYV